MKKLVLHGLLIGLMVLVMSSSSIVAQAQSTNNEGAKSGLIYYHEDSVSNYALKCHRVYVQQNVGYTIKLHPFTNNVDLYVRDAAGNYIRSSTNGGTQDEFVFINKPTNHPTYWDVCAYGASQGQNYGYWVSVYQY